MIVDQWELRTKKSGTLEAVHWSKGMAENALYQGFAHCEVVHVRTNVDLHRYTVNLFRRDDSMCLYGIPYDMKPGQQPGDIWRAIRDAPYRSPADCWRMGAPYHQPTLPPEGWIWLGSPGWWGSMSKEEQGEAKSFLADLERMSPGIVPQGPFEWVALKGHPDLRAFHLEHGHIIQAWSEGMVK